MPTFYLSATLDRKWDNLITLVETSAQVTNNEFEEEDEEEDDAQVTNNEFEQEEEEGYDDESILTESSVEANANSRTTNGNLNSNNILESSSSSSSSVPELPPQEFLMKFKELCGENPIILVIQKSLSKTDVSCQQARISLPAGKIKNFGFLTEEEKEMLHAEAEKKCREEMLHAEAEKKDRRTVEVTLIHKPIINGEGLDDNGMKETEIKLGQWNMHKKKDKNGKEKKASVMYVLQGTRRAEVLEENMLEEDDEVQIWASRKTLDNKLCMALVVLSKKIQRLVIEDV
ncbi:hypothetical protein PIB30_064660 [Stylosanthes scabra]|uniref:Uncharacterized protein n=1 Tax=Stylosanthes scabra TaxID=79078 RepID=A0ABU6RMD5_9FABA|nr:hypothetical protein [Stylosanthes scabra]